MTRWHVETATGSRYTVTQRDDGTWWFGGRNVPNALSCELPADQEWEIDPPSPWPPELGHRMRLESIYRFGTGGDRRVPRGGKVTSQVTAVTVE